MLTTLALPEGRTENLADLRYWRRTWHKILCHPTLVVAGISTIRVIMKCYHSNSNSYLGRTAQKDRENITVKKLGRSAGWLCSSQLNNPGQRSQLLWGTISLGVKKKKKSNLLMSWGSSVNKMVTVCENALLIHLKQLIKQHFANSREY